MRDTTSGIGPVSRRWTAGLLALGLLAHGSIRAADAVAHPAPPIVTASPATIVPVHDLDSLRAIALANNPSIAAAKASLASAIAGKAGVDNIRVPVCLQPDLPFRRQQASLGVQAAEAGVRQAEMHTVFGVEYAYVSYLYASQQELLAKQTVEEKEGSQNLASITKSVRDLFPPKDENKTDIREREVFFLEGALAFAHSKLVEASAGKQRALSALREAAGLGCDVPLYLKHNRLLDVKRSLDLRQLIDLAYVNRPELFAASINVQVCDLEVKAQASRNSLTVRTFASGGDLHSSPLPAGRYDQEYRPGVSGPEMPTSLSGKKCDRVARAAALASRAASVSDKARALVTLEIEQAYLRYEEAAAKVAFLDRSVAKIKEALEGGGKDKAGKDIDGASGRLKNAIASDGAKAALDDVLKFGQIYAQARAQANEARYQQLIALITLERATGGAFHANLSGATQVQDAAATEAKDKGATKSKDE